LSPPPVQHQHQACAHLPSTLRAGGQGLGLSHCWENARQLPAQEQEAPAATPSCHLLHIAAGVFFTVELGFIILEINWCCAVLVQEKLQIPGPSKGLFSQWVNWP
jgi:hypothetical protein